MFQRIVVPSSLVSSIPELAAAAAAATVVVVVVVVLLLLPPPPQNSLLTSLTFAPNSEAVSATRISLMASSSSFIYFFPAIAQDPQSSAMFRLLCMTRHSFRNLIPVDMNVFYSDSKTDLKL